MRQFVLLCTLALLGASNPILGLKPGSGEAGAVNKPNGKSDSDQPVNADQRGTRQLPLVIDTEGHQRTEPEKNEATKKENRAREVERWTLYFAQLTAWATVVLVLVGIGGTVAAVCTILEIRKQTLATEIALTLSLRAKDRGSLLRCFPWGCQIRPPRNSH